MKTNHRTIFQHGWGRLPICCRIEIGGQFCSMANFSGTNLRAGRSIHEPDKAFHNPEPAVAATPSWLPNHGLYSSHAVAASLPEAPVTSPFLSAIFLPVGRSNSWECPSRPATVTRLRQNTVFTQTHNFQKCLFLACLSLNKMLNGDGFWDRQYN
jgi:hypothetical protein